MPENPRELESLLSMAGGIKEIQQSFDDYQRACFTTRPPEFFSLELCGEAGELANLEKKSWKGRDIETERFAEEAADTLIALMNYANSRGVDLAAAVALKLRAIERRRQDG